MDMRVFDQTLTLNVRADFQLKVEQNATQKFTDSQIGQLIKRKVATWKIRMNKLADLSSAAKYINNVWKLNIEP